MADKIRIEIGGSLAPILLRLAREQGRDPNQITAEALERYFQKLGIEVGPTIGSPLHRETVRPIPDDPERPPLPSLLDRMSRRFDLDEDEAMRVAVEEQHAFRAERNARRRAEG